MSPLQMTISEVLYESGFDAECDAVLAVIADTPTRIGRIMKRDGIDEEMAIKRISKQKPSEFYLEKADFIIENGAGVQKEVLMERVREIVSELKRGKA
jgi:dephospho-CoA kinase